MTDEELWLKHIEEYPQIKTWSEEKREGARKGFKSGLTEGKKDVTYMKAEDYDKYLDVCRENEQLKKELDSYKALDSHYDEIEEDSKRIAEENERLKWEVKEITEDNDYYQKVNNEQTEVILKLNEQIERMKNFVKSMYEANKKDSYCREYLGTILNEWEITE